MITLPALTAEQRHHLTLAMTAIAAAETGPDPEDLAAAPALDLWRPLATLDLALVLWGHVSGHPRFAPGPIVTSRLIALNRQDGWARTLSRWYRLAEPFTAFEGALARDAGLSGSGMRIATFDFGGYIPVDDPTVLDRLLADYAARVRACDGEKREHR
ncbi:ATP-dependent Lon protease [Paracoccus sp. YIM 132242]|uniref:ATP-dependent Lon protease n=1 Tax=Paracoccus lichenicola TaxID=2665644 RepID=A0A6L6HRW2_9RHOB|nr:DUF6634 family protein [Paracoccus lichenicola]MTE01936.1 ATP-dependent Lon protease [Paracoccus lichenicola]